jgi:hypothetical protein
MESPSFACPARIHRACVDQANARVGFTVAPHDDWRGVGRATVNDQDLLNFFGLRDQAIESALDA